MSYRAAAAFVLAASLAGSAVAQTAADAEQARQTLSRLVPGTTGPVWLSGSREFTRDPGVAVSVTWTGDCAFNRRWRAPVVDGSPQSGKVLDGEEDFRDADSFPGLALDGSRVTFMATFSTGDTRRIWWQMASAEDAQRTYEAMRTLTAYCAGQRSPEDTSVEDAVIDPRGKVAALAIDRNNGNQYGWAVDYDALPAAEARARQECSSRGANCHVVLRFTGGCGAYAVDASRGSTAWGWGTAASRGEAESRAHAEVRKRGGTSPVTRVWGCNSTRSGIDEAERARQAAASEALNAEVRARDAAIVARNNAAQAEYERKVKAREAEIARIEHEKAKAKADYEAQMAKHRAAVAEAERARRQWECETGQKDKCG